MKTDIHPQYYPQAQVACACGNTFTAGSTKPTIRVEICAACHPFYTGQMKFVDTAGRVDKFQAKLQAAQQQHYVKKKAKKEAKVAAQKAALEAAPQTMKEMIAEARLAPTQSRQVRKEQKKVETSSDTTSGEE